MAAFRGISHCYQRPTYADWPYQLFTMAHGRSKEECDAILDAIEAAVRRDRATAPRSTARPSSRRSASCTSRTTSGTGSASTRAPRWARRPPRCATRARPSCTRAPSSACPAASTRRCGRCARSAATRSSSSAPRAPSSIDVDGNRYVDWVCSWGPLIHGHAHPEIVAAVTAAAAARARPSARRPPREVELAEEVAAAHARGRDAAHDLVGHRGVDERDPPRPRRDRPREDPQVRGRLPRPRRRAARRGGQRPGHAGDPGQPRRARGGDGEHRDRPVERRRGRCARPPRAHELAAILCRALRRRTWASSRRPRASSSCCASAPTATGALLVFDEVITGFRVARGGAQELHRRRCPT